MTNRKIIYWAIFAISIFAIIFAIKRPQGNLGGQKDNPPPKDTSVKNGGAQLSERQKKNILFDLAKNTNRTAANQRNLIDVADKHIDFERKRNCFDSKKMIFALQEMVVNCEAQKQEKNAGLLKCDADLVPHKEELARLESKIQDDRCATDLSTIQNEYYDSVKKAAYAGDADAQICYLNSNFGVNGKNRQFSEDDAVEYKSNAPVYVESALLRGDWRVVKLFTITRFSSATGLLGEIHDGGPLTALSMNRLLRLGASGDYAQELDAKYNSEAKGGMLTQAQIDGANNWANDTYKNYFQNAPALTASPIPCQ